MSIVGTQFSLPRGAAKGKVLSRKVPRASGSGYSCAFPGLQCFGVHGRTVRSAALAALLLHAPPSRADDLAVQVIGLPPLRIEGQPARGHIQGLELAGGKYYMTARRDDVHPRRALLLRTDAAASGWDVWDITPQGTQDAVTVLDHPGGMQSDGTRLWIPVAESKRHSRSVIRAFPLADLEAGRQLKPVFEFPVGDHIGAVAVSTGQGLLFGANWDTEVVYVWDLQGHLQRTLRGDELEGRGLGVVSGAGGRSGVAVQDWKIVGDRLFASGLFGSSNWATVSPASRLCCFEHFLERGFTCQTVTVPRREGIELGREAMAIGGESVYFLPEDLGASNRLFRLSLAELVKRGKTL